MLFLYSCLEGIVEYSNMDVLLICTIFERNSMEERCEDFMGGFSCAMKVCVLVGLFLLGSLSRETMNFM